MALAEYDMVFFITVPSFSYLIRTIFPERGLIGPDRSIASESEASSGSFTTPGDSTLPKIFTEINFGEIPDKIEFEICFGLDLLSFGKNKVSPSNIRISLVVSDSLK